MVSKTNRIFKFYLQFDFKSGHLLVQFAGSYEFLDSFYAEKGMFPILFRELREHEKSFDMENPRDFTGTIWILEFSRTKYILYFSIEYISKLSSLIIKCFRNTRRRILYVV